MCLNTNKNILVGTNARFDSLLAIDFWNCLHIGLYAGKTIIAKMDPGQQLFVDAPTHETLPFLLGPMKLVAEAPTDVAATACRQLIMHIRLLMAWEKVLHRVTAIAGVVRHFL